MGAHARKPRPYFQHSVLRQVSTCISNMSEETSRANVLRRQEFERLKEKDCVKKNRLNKLHHMVTNIILVASGTADTTGGGGGGVPCPAQRGKQLQGNLQLQDRSSSGPRVGKSVFKLGVEGSGLCPRNHLSHHPQVLPVQRGRIPKQFFGLLLRRSQPDP